MAYFLDCCVLFMMITPHASHACRLTMKNFSGPCDMLTFCRALQQSSWQGWWSFFFRLSQYNSTVYGDAGASASRNITLAVFAYASLSNCPSTSILWQTQLRPNLAVLLSVLRWCIILVVEQSTSLNVGWFNSPLFVQTFHLCCLGHGDRDWKKAIKVKKDRTHLSPSYSEQIALPFSTIMGAHPHSRWGPSVRYLGWLNYQGNIWQDGSVHWNLLVLVVVLVLKNFHCSGASLWVLNEKDCCRMSILTPTAHGAMLYSHSWLLRGIGKDCLLFVYVPNLYHTECWSTQMFCIPSWQEYLW